MLKSCYEKGLNNRKQIRETNHHVCYLFTLLDELGIRQSENEQCRYRGEVTSIGKPALRVVLCNYKEK